jgi:aryl-alcohol dehydrogenase-like predicted oxidoreductase
MQHRRLGTSEFEISTIGLGTWAIGGYQWGGQEDAASIAAIEAAVDHGVNWIDTAPIYGSGHSETIVGRAIKGLPASRRPLIFTKFGLGLDAGNPTRSASAPGVLAECNGSLQRLGVPHIDLYQLHWPAPQPIAETAAACHELLKAGKIRAIGVSNFSVAELEEWRATGVPLVSLQSPYSILRPAVKDEQLPWCAEHRVGAIAYSPLFRGLLFGTWNRDKTFPADDARGAHKDYVGARFQRILDAIDEIKALANASGLSCAQLSVGVLLQTPGLTGCIVGARNARQGALISNLGVAVTDDQARAVWAVAAKLKQDLEAIPA